MNKNYLSIIFLLAIGTLALSCKSSSENKKIEGKWHSEDQKTTLTITSKDFTIDEGEGPLAESYFLKGDTIFTSYEGTAPYTAFAIKKLSDKNMVLVYPDSTSVQFLR